MRTIRLLVAAAAAVAAAHARFMPAAQPKTVGLVPNWEPTYNMQRSTVAMPCNYSGLFDPAFSAQFGIVDYDWSNGKQIWANQAPMACESLLVEQAAQVRAVSNATRVWVYRNLVKALPWFDGVREKINDPAYSGWFLKFAPGGTYHQPTCDNNWSPARCSDYYHDQDQTPEHPHGDGSCVAPCDCGGVPCGEYLWDHRNASLRDWLINEHLLGPTGLGNRNISGFYTDDGWSNTSQPILPWMPSIGYCDHSPIGGPSEEDFYCTEDMALTQDDTTAIKEGWAETIRQAQAAIVAAGGFLWQGFYSTSTPPAGNPSSCASTFRSWCSPNSEAYTSALMFNWGWNKTTGILYQKEQDLASFLLIRGPYAWLGYGWIGCSSGAQGPGAGGGADYAFPPELFVDYGEPTGQCSETVPGQSGVFTRTWSKATVSFDCNSWTGSVTPSLE